jgi:hypothetical protein
MEHAMSSESNRTAVIDVTPAGEVGPPAALVNAGHAIYACYAVGFFIGVIDVLKGSQGSDRRRG